ncbi:DUF502 domain-containing protein [Nitrospira sp. Kam-Ns4a]
MPYPHRLRRYFLTGLLVLVPAWGTLLIMETLFTALDGLIADLAGLAVKSDVPGLGLVMLVLIILSAGAIGAHLLGQRILRAADELMERIPLVRSIYVTLKGMTDLFNFRSRFGGSPVVVFPFPRDGLWALGFAMGLAPDALQVSPAGPLITVFVPTAIHPFTGYLAFIPRGQVIPVNLSPEDAMKVEFSAGLFRPRAGWLTRRTPEGPDRGGADA